ncbi:MAG TPA: glycosyltransferase family protein [Anaerolineaceae bacterium]|nr:glycosyltransferase family protein [Anaerolineaceae bacterium]
MMETKDNQNRPVVAIIQARMSSSRLPGKALLPIAGVPMLKRVFDRVQRASLVDKVVVATTSDPSDDAIEKACAEWRVACFRGSLYDVLDRYYQAAKFYNAKTIVRITADCPMIDPLEIDKVLTRFFETDCDFAANRLPPPFNRTTPIGMDTEVCSFDALQRAWENAELSFEREHVMPWLYETPGRAKICVVDDPRGIGHLRFTVDTPADYALAEQIYTYFGKNETFGLDELLAANAKHPEWQASLKEIQHKSYLDTDHRALNQEEKP